MDNDIAAAQQALKHVPLMAARVIGGTIGKLARALKERDAEIESLKRELAAVRGGRTIWKCFVCGVDVPDYEPEYCCDGRECGCMGMPIEPPLCSKSCSEKVFGLGDKGRLKQSESHTDA